MTQEESGAGQTIATRQTSEAKISPVKTLDHWTKTISGAWYRSIQSFLEVGRFIIEAEASLPDSEIRELRDKRLPFGPAVYSKLKTIAADPKLNDEENQKCLPSAYSTLYELSQLDETSFKSAIESGAINPSLTRLEAARFRKKDAAPQTQNGDASAEERVAAVFATDDLSASGAKDISKLLDQIAKVKGVSRVFRGPAIESRD
jgi:hypothetical protein